jgi:acyl carrier protein
MDDSYPGQHERAIVALKAARTMSIPCEPRSTRGARTMERQEIQDGVRRFITENFPLGGSGFELGGSDSLLEAGVIDSVGVLELIEYLEAGYGIQIPDEDVLPENLDSIEAIARYVSARLERRDER